tara:strand:- start:2172 stop:2645 length:474 start_codon:yes stop_codon:yes gene_type:complete
MPEYEIRQMQEAELDAVTQLLRDASEYSWNARQIRDSLQAENNSSYLLCDKDSGQILAYAVFLTVLDECQLLNIAVERSQQGRGLGYLFLQELIEAAGKTDTHSFFLEVRASNHVAIRLYEKLGFVKTGIRKNYYQGVEGSKEGREDAWLYSLSLLS